MWKSCNEEQFNQFQMPFSRQHSRKKIRARAYTLTLDEINDEKILRVLEKST